MFNSLDEIIGCNIETFLLEKVRIINNQPNERNFHIFYQILDGITKCEKDKLYISNIDDYDNYMYYKSSIVFVNSIQTMIKSIHYYLENNKKYLEKIKNIKFIEDTSFIHDYLK